MNAGASAFDPVVRAEGGENDGAVIADVANCIFLYRTRLAKVIPAPTAGC
jgi:hypothetical protein